jgi:hypothetical protein
LCSQPAYFLLKFLLFLGWYHSIVFTFDIVSILSYPRICILQLLIFLFALSTFFESWSHEVVRVITHYFFLQHSYFAVSFFDYFVSLFLKGIKCFFMTCKLTFIIYFISLFAYLGFNSPLLDVFPQIIYFNFIFHHFLAILLFELLHLFKIVPVRNYATRVIQVKRRDIKGTLKPMLYFFLVL